MFYTRIKHGFFDQSEHAQGPIYVINSDKSWVFDQSEYTQVPIYIIIVRNTILILSFLKPKLSKTLSECIAKIQKSSENYLFPFELKSKLALFIDEKPSSISH